MPFTPPCRGPHASLPVFVHNDGLITPGLKPNIKNELYLFGHELKQTKCIKAFFKTNRKKLNMDLLLDEIT